MILSLEAIATPSSCRSLVLHLIAGTFAKQRSSASCGNRFLRVCKPVSSHWGSLEVYVTLLVSNTVIRI